MRCERRARGKKLVMPGFVPGIHVLAAVAQERRGSPGLGERKRRRPSDGYGPAMTKKKIISSDVVSLTVYRSGIGGRITGPSSDG
jgi:hypothetical protein